VLQALLDEATPRLFEIVEETLVRVAFAHVGDNQVRSARVLGVTRNTLLKRYGLLAESTADRRGSGGELDAATPLAH
jgi:sigma-54-specific transcriptional regulator